MPHFALSTDGVPSDSIVLADGSLWSHAATLGTYYKGESFTIDRDTIESFIKNFTLGYPQKVPVDYEHGTVSGATATGQPVPKAGDVLELKGVYAPTDLVGDVRQAAEKLARRAGAALDETKALGLWMRWRPTARALQMIKAGEYSELSLAFAGDHADNRTGASQGPALLSVALTNMPFLDSMMSVAASRRDGGRPAAPGSSGDRAMSNTMLLSAAAAIVGKAVATEEEAITQLTALQPELVRLRAFAKDVGAEIGEAEPAPAVEKIRGLKVDLATHVAEAERQKLARIDTQVESTLKAHEDRLTPATKPFFAKQLKAELVAGVALDKSETLTAIKALTPHTITTQKSGADGGTDLTQEQAHKAKTNELMTSDPEIVALAKTNPNAAQLRASAKAAEMLAPKA